MRTEANISVSLSDLIIPTVTTKNGIIIANFSSPHTFNFNDGSVLEACSAMRALQLSIQGEEHEIHNVAKSGARLTDLVLRWTLSDIVRIELDRVEMIESFDVLLIPLPMMTALKLSNRPIGRARCVRTASDRGASIRVNYANRFCI